MFKNAGHENKNAILAHSNEQEYQILSVMVLIRFWLLVQGMKTKFKTKLKLKIRKNGMTRTKNDNDIKRKQTKKKMSVSVLSLNSSIWILTGSSTFVSISAQL